MNVRVVVRVRPLLSTDRKQAVRRQREAKRARHLGRTAIVTEAFSCVERSSENEVTVRTLNPATDAEYQREFAFDNVVDHKESQASFFKSCGVDRLIKCTLDGYAAVVFAYGQTGSGKTYTMSGVEEQTEKTEHSPETDGLIPRSLSYLYGQIYSLKKQNKSVLVSASYLEIYNEQVFDLLNCESGNPLQLRYQYGRGFFVEKQLVVQCENFEDLCAVAAEGHNNRTVRSHSLNMHSSRSHSIFTVYVETKDLQDEEASSVYGKISFIDLAGSENVKQSQSEGIALKETNNINKSLFALGKVISVLAAKHQGTISETSHIPFRDSALTKLLMDSLGGNGMAMMIACCSPSSLHVDETLRTLQYATRAKNIINKPIQNISQRDAKMQELREELRLLRGENAALRRLLDAHGIAAPAPLTSSIEPAGGMIAPSALVRPGKLSVPNSTHRASSSWWKAPETPVANFHDQTGMVAKSPTSRKSVVGTRESAATSVTLPTYTPPLSPSAPSQRSRNAIPVSEAKPFSRSQGRLLQRLERRSSRRGRRTPRGTPSRSSARTDATLQKEALPPYFSSQNQSQAEIRLAQENKKLRSRLNHLEKVFVKGAEADKPIEENLQRREITVDAEMEGGFVAKELFNGVSRMASTASVNVATPHGLPSYTSVVSTPLEESHHVTPAGTHPAINCSRGDTSVHVPLSHPFFDS